MPRLGVLTLVVVMAVSVAEAPLNSTVGVKLA